MSQPFSFPPPPPPPPPKPQQDQNRYQHLGSRGGNRGRGSFQHGQQSGQHRGQYPPRGRSGHGSRGSGMNHSRGGYAPDIQNPSSWAGPAQPQRHYATAPTDRGQKRDHTAAFNDRPNNTARNHRPLAPPAVPSFGFDIDSLLPKKPEPQMQSPHGSAKKSNLLGLTPVARDEDSEEDDEEEENKLASTISTNNLLQFEYKGRTATLNTPEEIAAWIAERRKKWPTQQKREAAQREADEQKRKWEADKAARLEASKIAAKVRQEERLKQKIEREKSQVRQKLLREQIQKAKAAPAVDSTQTVAQAKAEKLRRKAEKIAEQLRIAEAALDKHQDNVNDDHAAEPDLDTLLAQVDTIASAQKPQANDINTSDSASDSSDASSARLDAVPHDETSTSGSSSEADSDSDSAPEESSTKRTAPDRVLPPSRKPPAGSSTDNRPLCKNFAQHGRCKFGRKCHFKHEKPGKKDESTIGNRRKGLYQIMVEKEQEEERKKALRAIIALGEAGVLDEMPEKAECPAVSGMEAQS